MTTVALSRDLDLVTVRVPMRFRTRGTKRIIVPDGAEWAPAPQTDTTLLRAVARAFRWRRQLEEGVHATIRELAAAEKVGESYACRLLRLTLLAPGIIEAILDGRQPPGLQLSDLTKPLPAEWEQQREMLMVAEPR